jgi:hypothetical protein
VAVYRPTRRQRPLALWLALGLLAIIILGGAAFLLLRPAPVSDLAAAKAALTEASSRLDLLTVEYPKLLAGQSSGADAALQSAGAALTRAQPTLQTLDPAWFTARQGQLDSLKTLVANKAPADQVTAASTVLISEISAWLRSH